MKSEYIGLDQSLSQTGVAVWRDGTIVVTEIKTDAQQPHGQRLLHLESSLRLLLERSADLFWEYVFAAGHVPYESMRVLGLVEKLAAEYGMEGYCFRSGGKEGKRSSGHKSWRFRVGVSSDKKDLQAKLGLAGKANHNISDAIGILGAGLLHRDVLADPEQLFDAPIIIPNGRNTQALLHCLDNL